MSGAGGRLEARFDALREEGRAGLVAYVMSGDPDPATSSAILAGLPAAGADVIELGMAFTDPMADGPSVQAAGLRALKSGISLRRTLDILREFRRQDDTTPVVLMGYFNPIYAYGVDAFLKDARDAGLDGLIVVDLPPEEDKELCLPALSAGLNFIRLATPTTDDERLPTVLRNTSGFVYYVSYAGITGAKTAQANTVEGSVQRIRKQTDLPIAVGFGIRTPQQAAEIARVADAVVVGSAFTDAVQNSLDAEGRATDGTTEAVLTVARELAAGVRSARVAG